MVQMTVILVSVDLEYSVLLEARSHWSDLGPEHHSGPDWGCSDEGFELHCGPCCPHSQNLRLSEETLYRDL